MARRKNALRRGMADSIHIVDLQEAGLPSLRPYDVSIGVESVLAVRVMASSLDHAAKLANVVAQNALTKISNRGKPIDAAAEKGHTFYAWPSALKSVSPRRASAEATEKVHATIRFPARKGRRRTAR